MKLKLTCKIIKKIPLIASLAFLIGCTTTIPEPKLFNSHTDKYAYLKEYMRWYIKEQMKVHNIVGMSVALVDDQKIVWQEGFGYADKAKDIKATPQTRYRAGSITKLFTAMAVMKLSEEGKMNIDKPLRRYLPEFKIKSRFGSTDGITPRTIMTHHSGLPGDWLDRMFATNPLPYTAYVKAIRNEYVAYKPNTILSYSNLAVALLGHVVEKVSGIKYERYVNKVLLSPLQMKHSSLHILLAGENTSKGYSGAKEVKEYPMGDIPAGGLNTSVEELSHLAMMINANGRYGGRRVLSSTSLHHMFTVQNKDIRFDMDRKIGLGYFIDTNLLGEKNPIYIHGGATVAHRAFFAVAPKSKLGIVVLSNSTSTDIEGISKVFFKKAWEAKTSQKIIKKEKKIQIKDNDHFDGVYATMMGKVRIKKRSNGVYTAYTEKGVYTLTKNTHHLYKAKYKLLKMIPISNDVLEKVGFYTKDIDGKHIIIMRANGMDTLVGMRVRPYSISKRWKSYLGHYKVLNNFEPEGWKIKDTEIVIEDGYVVMRGTVESGEKSATILNPVNDTEAIVEGLGRGMQETVYYKDGVLHRQGLRFEKIE